MTIHKLLNLASPNLYNKSKNLMSQQRNFTSILYNNHQRVVLSQILHQNKIYRQSNSLRKFSDKPPGGGDKAKDTPNEERTDLVLTPGQKVVAGTRLTMYLGMFGAAITCLYFTARELLPTKMSPNSVFNNAHSILKDNSDVAYRFGSPIKTYGKDHGGKREGRRNFIEHSEYTDKDDGSKRVRVRFNLEGPKGNAFVFAEVSNEMSSGEFVYLLVQDKRNGRVLNIIDNRSMLAAKRMAGGNKEGEAAFANLLGGGRSN